MSRALLWIFSTVLIWPNLAYGQRSCLPPYTALQTLEWMDPARPQSFRYQLKEPRASGMADTRVHIQGQSDLKDPHLIRLTVGFDREFDGVSLPYSVYALLILRDGEVVMWWDFTHACQGPGLSFFPGKEIELPSLKLVGDKPQKLQIMVWGRL